VWAASASRNPVVKESSMATTPVASDFPAPEPQPEAKISPFGRIVGILFSPKPTYEDIARKPNWLLPVILTTVLSLIAVAVLNQKVNWPAYIRDQMDKNPRAAQLSAEQKQQQVEFWTKLTVYITWASGALGPIIAAVIIGGILMGSYNLLAGAGVGFSHAMAIVAHAGLVGIVQVPIFVLVVLLKDPTTIEPNNILATNLAAFLPEGAPKVLEALGKNIDIFVLWSTLLMAIGFAAANPKKLKGGKSYAIAFGMLAFWTVLRMGLAFIFS
jgi:hypothetical protein